MSPRNGWTLVPWLGISHRKQIGDSFVNHRSVSWLLLVVIYSSPKWLSLSGRSSGQHIPPLSLNNNSMDPVSLLLGETFEGEGEKNELCSLHLAAGSWGARAGFHSSSPHKHSKLTTASTKALAGCGRLPSAIPTPTPPHPATHPNKSKCLAFRRNGQPDSSRFFLVPVCESSLVLF